VTYRYVIIICKFRLLNIDFSTLLTDCINYLYFHPIKKGVLF